MDDDTKSISYGVETVKSEATVKHYILTYYEDIDKHENCDCDTSTMRFISVDQLCETVGRMIADGYKLDNLSLVIHEMKAISTRKAFLTEYL